MKYSFKGFLTFRTGSVEWSILITPHLHLRIQTYLTTKFSPYVNYVVQTLDQNWHYFRSTNLHGQKLSGILAIFAKVYDAKIFAFAYFRNGFKRVTAIFAKVYPREMQKIREFFSSRQFLLAKIRTPKVVFILNQL